MRRLWRFAKIVGSVLTLLYVVVSWIEAEREIRVLCSGFEAGQRVEQVVATLETGEYLRYQVGGIDARREIYVSSFYNGLRTACTVAMDEEGVTESTYRTGAHAYLLFGQAACSGNRHLRKLGRCTSETVSRTGAPQP
jgi:hypothetical protein